MSNSVISANSPLSRTVSRSPQLKSTPATSNVRYEETLVSQEVQPMHLLTKCTESWQMYWRVHGKEIKSDWLDLPLRMQKTTSCRCLLILGIKLLLQKFDANLAAISNYFSIPLRVRDSGFLYCISGEAAEEIWYWSLLGSARENSWRRTCPLPTWPACEKKRESERASILTACCVRNAELASWVN